MRATHWAAAQSSKQILVSKYGLGKQREEMEIFNITFLVHDIQNYFNSQEGLFPRVSSKPMFAVRFFRYSPSRATCRRRDGHALGRKPLPKIEK